MGFLCKTIESLKKNGSVLKSHPNCESFLQEKIKKVEDVIKKEEEDYKNEIVFNKDKKLCEYDVTNFKNLVLPGFKYKLDMLDNDDKDYKLLESSLKYDTSEDNSQFNLQKNNSKNFKMYRVVLNDYISTELSPTNHKFFYFMEQKHQT